MVSAAQVNATERLIAQLDRMGFELDQTLIRLLTPLFASGDPDPREIYEIIFSEVLKRSGKVGRPMYAAISTAVSKPYVDFADPDLDSLGKEVSYITGTVVASGSARTLAGPGSAMKDYVMTQVRSSVAVNVEPYQQLVRLADASPCPWCADRDGSPAPGGRIQHHKGCGCYVGVR